MKQISSIQQKEKKKENKGLIFFLNDRCQRLSILCFISFLHDLTADISSSSGRRMSNECQVTYNWKLAPTTHLSIKLPCRILNWRLHIMNYDKSHYLDQITTSKHVPLIYLSCCFQPTQVPSWMILSIPAPLCLHFLKTLSRKMESFNVKICSCSTG